MCVTALGLWSILERRYEFIESPFVGFLDFEETRRLIHQETRHLTNYVRHFRGVAQDWDPASKTWLEYLSELADTDLFGKARSMKQC